MCTTGSVDAVIIQAGTFSWSRDERPVLEKCVHAYMHVALLCICHLQYQSTHQAWSVSGRPVVGHVGAGKSSLISALLGEMEKLTGRVSVKVKQR